MTEHAVKAGASRISTIVFMALLAACATTETLIDNGPPRQVVSLQLPAGSTDVDVYRPSGSGPAPLVIVAHGFARSRDNMAGWGQHLAGAGILTVVPDLPTRADHERNARFLQELRHYLLDDPRWRADVDPTRVGLLGFSAGALSSLMSATLAPGVAVWVGLDPVDRDGLAVRAAEQYRGRAIVITAEPSACNAYGNVEDMLSALAGHEHYRVEGAVHVDAEWPGTRAGDLACGRSTAARRAMFRALATRALEEVFDTACIDSGGQSNEDLTYSAELSFADHLISGHGCFAGGGCC